MMSRTPIPVRAAHDLLHSAPPIREGTPGEIVDMSENGLYSYTVTFHAADLAGGTVTVRDLSRADLREA